MLQGGQFSKSRKHAVWLPSYLEQYDADSLRYYLSINMPETHDTDFRWDEYVDRVNNELIGTYGNFVHRVMTLTHRLECDEGNRFRNMTASPITARPCRRLTIRSPALLSQWRSRGSKRHFVASWGSLRLEILYSRKQPLEVH